MSNTVYITGHRNPDTDSICSSIAYAQLKKKLNMDAIACRLGDLNTETEFVLRKFDMSAPVYIENAKCRLEDIEIDIPTLITPDTTVKDAWDKITKGKNKSLFVVNSQMILQGVVSMSNISDIQMQGSEFIQKLMSHVPLDNIVETIHGNCRYQPKIFRCNGDVHILMEDDFTFNTNYQESIVIVSKNKSQQIRYLNQQVACMIIPNCTEVEEEIILEAKRRDIALITTEQSAMKIARFIYQTLPIELIMSTDLVTFKSTEYVDEVSKRMSKTRFRSYPVVDEVMRVLGAVSRFHLFSYQRKKFILLDHNETSQSVESLEVADVLEIIDHHRIGDIETSGPINFRNQNLGSTCSIIAQMYQEHQLTPSPQIAGLLCCAIISDTMNFNSPTTTIEDKKIAHDLAMIADLDLASLAQEMFESVATLRGRSFSEIMYNDFKEYAIEGFRIAIGQINILDVKELEVIKREFISYMEKINSINKYDLLMMVFTNVEGKGSNFIFTGKLSFAVDELFQEEKIVDHYFVQGIVSRKKQIIPRLSAAFKLV